MTDVDAGSRARPAVAVLAQYRTVTTEQTHLILSPGALIEQTRLPAGPARGAQWLPETTRLPCRTTPSQPYAAVFVAYRTSPPQSRPASLSGPAPAAGSRSRAGPLIPPSQVRSQGGGTRDTPGGKLFAAIVCVLVGGCAWWAPVLHRAHRLTMGDAVTAELVGDRHARCSALPLHRLGQEFTRRPGCPAHPGYRT